MVKPLAKSLAGVYKNIMRCDSSRNLKLSQNKCICEENKKNYDKICVVENLADMWVIDSSDIFKGHFHILGGTINPNEDYNQKNLLINSLVKRIKSNNIKEVIIATSATIEGQTTAHYLEDIIKNDKIKISKLGQGLPVGGDLEYMDELTLARAIEGRTEI